MVTNPSYTYLSPEGYLTNEEHSPIKHEYIDGQIFAMTEASDAHVTIAGNLFALLREHVRGSGYRADYQHLETLQEYVLISQKRQRVECFRRNEEGLWVLRSYTPGSEIYLSSVDFHIGLDAVYEDMNFAVVDSAAQVEE
jgi:Uma2 family endonuclease